VGTRGERQCGEPLALGTEDCLGADHESICPQLDQGCKGRIEVALGARLQDMKRKPESAGRGLHASRNGLREQIVRHLTNRSLP
jgi:hypothetical protein